MQIKFFILAPDEIIRSERALANQNRNPGISYRDRLDIQTNAFDPQNALSNCSSICHRQGEWDTTSQVP